MKKNNIESYFRYEQISELKYYYLVAHTPNKQFFEKLSFFSNNKVSDKRKPTYKLTAKNQYITGVFFLMDNSNYAYGDYQDDCLLFTIENKAFEIFFIRKQKKNARQICLLFKDGYYFNKEINKLRENAKKIHYDSNKLRLKKKRELQLQLL